eukprot:Transcript_21730.p2 GENE.Transcript_21730~~Transcript_21730.p2  ORF type:complete len:295 (-),score=72.70 Transcript_21730:1528-2412(-)
MKRTVWTAPTIERTASTLLAAALPTTYQQGDSFQLLTRESGSVRRDLPIWVSKPDIVRWSESYGPVVRTGVPGVRGAFVLSHVLTTEECDQILKLSQSMGYTEDAPVSLGRNIRRNENCVWLADDSLWQPIWRRAAPHMPPRVEGGRPAGLNQRWRLYRYGPDDIFRMHTDGSWPGSKADLATGSVVRDAYGDRWSQLTFLIYLDDDYDGGETTFLVDAEGYPAMPRGGLIEGGPDAPQLRGVRVSKGSVLCFFHGDHELSLLHEGSVITRGFKHIVRSDVLYMLRGAEPKEEV